MTRNYAITGTGLVVAATLLVWPFAGPSVRSGVVVAALVAVPIQIASFALMLRCREQLDRFLVVWVGGTVVRMITIGVVAFLVLRSGGQGVTPTLLALASFFFGLLLLEPIYFRPVRGPAG